MSTEKDRRIAAALAAGWRRLHDGSEEFELRSTKGMASYSRFAHTWECLPEVEECSHPNPEPHFRHGPAWCPDCGKEL